MLIDLTDGERSDVLFALARQAHEQEEFASAPGVVGTAGAAPFIARAAAARALIAKIDKAVLDAFTATLNLPPTLTGPGACRGCGGNAHQVVAGDRSWIECTHGCGWTTEPGKAAAAR
jgi:hypothetical protein